jgi:hypothetical protein
MESTPTIQGRNGDSKRKYVKRKSSDRDSKGGDRDRKGSDIWALRSSGGREGDRKKGSGDICRNTRWRGVRQKRRWENLRVLMRMNYTLTPFLTHDHTYLRTGR